MEGPNALKGAAARAVLGVACLNFAYFWIEMVVATRIGSVSLFADAIDFLEDTAINLLVLYALPRGLRLQAGVAILLAALICVPGLAALWTAIGKLYAPAVPSAEALTATAAGALAVNLVCALVLARVGNRGSLMRAAFLSARNDTLANGAIIAAGLSTAATASQWPDIAVGIGIAALNAEAAREVYVKARSEWRDAGRSEP